MKNLTFDQIIDTKIDRLEKWASRLQREIWIWKNVQTLEKNNPQRTAVPPKIIQTELFELIAGDK